MYVDIFFPLTKTIIIMFENVTTYYQTLQTWEGLNKTRYRTFSFILTRIGHNATCYHAYAEVSYMLLNVAAYWHRSNTEACAKTPFSDTCKQH